MWDKYVDMQGIAIKSKLHVHTLYLKSPKYSGIFIQDNYVDIQVTNI